MIPDNKAITLAAMDTYTIFTTGNRFPEYCLYVNDKRSSGWEKDLQALFSYHSKYLVPTPLDQMMGFIPHYNISVLCTFQTDQDPYEFIQHQYPELLL